jgi:hypothetical protein
VIIEIARNCKVSYIKDMSAPGRVRETRTSSSYRRRQENAMCVEKCTGLRENEGLVFYILPPFSFTVFKSTRTFKLYEVKNIWRCIIQVDTTNAT